MAQEVQRCFIQVLDLHINFSYITTMNERGDIVGQKKLPSNCEIVEFLKEFGEGMEVAIEATPSWYLLCDRLEDEDKVSVFSDDDMYNHSHG